MASIGRGPLITHTIVTLYLLTIYLPLKHKEHKLIQEDKVTSGRTRSPICKEQQCTFKYCTNGEWWPWEHSFLPKEAFDTWWWYDGSGCVWEAHGCQRKIERQHYYWEEQERYKLAEGRRPLGCPIRKTLATSAPKSSREWWWRSECLIQ